jgi:hypothetical protein
MVRWSLDDMRARMRSYSFPSKAISFLKDVLAQSGYVSNFCGSSGTRSN